ncbi:SLC13 family permease [cyanobacterium endosymbiont of Epithemia clementina EcSB]|uniref:SLC13 family permease n=1 Tax=cyanobacterium endosymbiont of Epithemia clementina EcSB TaxID=3034674 RepID=UPI00248016C9|nr:SLC13 family permease [cyanobacterium endosymbiont of Epithemia clementina EcSB]WGT67179.1 SLC13 family permease [cyanobacterium endosymbiont of Epithemia clementina EcSB]
MEIVFTLGVVVLALILFICERFPPDTTAITIVVILMLSGIVTPEEGIAGFGNSATITVMAMFILSAGITRTGALQVIQDWLIKWGGKSTNQNIFIIGIIVGPITAIINNTAVVAMFLPMIEEWSKKRNISSSKLMIPLSYCSILGGMLTLVGTSTNILASGLAKQLGYKEFGLFEFSKLGLITFMIGLSYLVIIAPKILPDRKPPSSSSLGESYNLKDYVSEVVITPRSSLVGQTLHQSEIQRKFDLDVLEIIHNNTRFPQPLADKIISVGDILLVRVNKGDLLKIKDEKGIEIFPNVQFNNESIEEEINTGEEKVAEILILSNSSLIGSTLKDIRFRQRYNATVLAVRRGEELVRERLGKVPLRFGDLLLVQGPKQSFIGLQTTREMLVLEERNLETIRQDKAGTALVIIGSVIILSAVNLLPILVSSLSGVLMMIFTRCLKPGEIYGSVRWDVIFLLAGLLPLGTAMNKSGATEWIANHLVDLGGNISGYWILTFFFLITSILTEVLSNNASVVLMFPIAVQVAETLNLNPYAFMFAVTFAASNSFTTPIGYQTNTMVYTPGGYRFLDFVRVGGPINLMMVIFVPILIMRLYGLEIQ